MPLIPASVCRSILVAGHHADSEPPLLSLREGRDALVKAQGVDLSVPLDFSHAYRDQPFRMDLSAPSPASPLSSKPRSTVARLVQLEADATSARGDDSVVGYAFRGEAQVRGVLERLSGNLAATNPLVLDEVRRMFPQPPPSSYSYHGHLWVADPYVIHTTADAFANQMERVRKVLAQPGGERAPFDYVNGRVDIAHDLRTETESKPQVPSGPTLTDMAASSVGSFAFNVHIFYDSLFYVDPGTREPVWLFYYRVFEGDIPAPRRPRRRSPLNKWMENARDWLKSGALAPGFAPSPVPVPVHR